MPLSLSFLSNKLATSGITRSIPSKSAPGNMRPQSMAMAASPYSRSIMLRPNSPNPPKGMILSGSIGTSNGSFLHGRSNRSRRLFLSGLGRLDLSCGLEVIFYELLNVHRELPQSSRPMIFHGYRGSDGYFDLAAPNAPIAFW